MLLVDSYANDDFSYVPSLYSYVTFVFSYVNTDYYNWTTAQSYEVVSMKTIYDKK